MNKRSTKKAIRRICGDVAGECIVASHFIKGVSTEEMHKIVIEVATLQTVSLEKVSVAYDKIPSDFGNKHEYNKERRTYFKKAFATLHKEVEAKLQEIVKAMNAALPQEAKDANKKTTE